MLADYNVYWFEEPLAPDDLEDYARLTELSPVKIAHSEVLTPRHTFVPYFARRAMDITQPDTCHVGGLSEMRRIAWMAEEHGIELVPHGWSTALAVAARVHLIASMPSRSYVEFHVGFTLIEDLTDPPFCLKEACLPVPDGSGLGVQINRDLLKSLEISGFSSPSWTWDDRKEFEKS